MTASEEVHLETVWEVEQPIFQLLLPSLLTYQFCKFSFTILFYTSVTTAHLVWLSPWGSLQPHNLIQTLLFLDSKQLQQTAFLYNHFPKTGAARVLWKLTLQFQSPDGTGWGPPCSSGCMSMIHPPKETKGWKVENDKVHSGLITYYWDKGNVRAYNQTQSHHLDTHFLLGSAVRWEERWEIQEQTSWKTY